MRNLKFITISALLTFILSCQQKTNKTDIIDSINRTTNAPEQEKWDFISPDTVSMRKNLTCVELKTTAGTMVVALFNETTKHKENFLKQVRNGYYSNVLFHRVIRNFMVQTGDPDSKKARPGQQLGQGGPGYTIPAEIRDTFYHYRGALSAARTSDEVNPGKESSGSQFYIVTGEPHGSVKMKEILRNRAIGLFLKNPDNLSYNLRLQNYQGSGNMAAMNVLLQELEVQVKPVIDSLMGTMPEKTKQMYATWGGYPGLDGEYSVFGFLVSGFHILDKIQLSQTDENNRPLEDIRILSARVLE